MRKIISTILLLTLYIVSHGYAGETLSYFSNSDKLAASLVSDPNINPNRRDPRRNDIAGKAKPGAIGNGAPLLELAQGKLPTRATLKYREFVLTASKLREAISVTMRLCIANKNKVPAGHQERFQKALDNLIDFQNNLEKRAYLYNADVRGTEHYLVGFNFRENVGLSLELIDKLYSISSLRLAQYIFHECVPEKGIITERDDHRIVYNEIQSAIFGQGEVLALKKDLRDFINKKAAEMATTEIHPKNATQIGSMTLQQLIEYVASSREGSTQLPIIVEKLRPDQGDLAIFTGAVRKRLSQAQAKDPNLTMEFLDRTVRESSAVTPKWVPLETKKGSDLADWIYRLGAAASVSKNAAQVLIRIYIDGQFVRSGVFEVDLGNNLTQGNLGEEVVGILGEQGKFDAAADYKVSTFDYVRRTSEIHVDTKGVPQKAKPAKVTAQKQYEWQIGTNIVAGFKQFMADWESNVAPTMPKESVTAREYFQVRTDSRSFSLQLVQKFRQTNQFDETYDRIEVDSDTFDIDRWRSRGKEDVLTLEETGFRSKDILVLRNDSISIEPAEGQYSVSLGKSGTLNISGYLKAIRFDRTTKKLTLVMAKEAVEFLKTHKYPTLMFVDFISVQSEYYDQLKLVEQALIDNTALKYGGNFEIRNALAGARIDKINASQLAEILKIDIGLAEALILQVKGSMLFLVETPGSPKIFTL